MRNKKKIKFIILTIFFITFVLFLYGPIFAVIILSFQGPNGGLTFPMNGFSFHWFYSLFGDQLVGDFKLSFLRSIVLGLIVMILTVLISLTTTLAYRKKFKSHNYFFYISGKII